MSRPVGLTQTSQIDEPRAPVPPAGGGGAPVVPDAPGVPGSLVPGADGVGTAEPGAGLRVLLVADTASMARGGEASLVLHYFRRLRQRGVDAHLIAHSRTSGELAREFPDDADRIHLIPDTRTQAFLWKIAKRVPDRIRFFTIQFVMRLLSQRLSKRIAREVIAAHDIQLVHQPTPVSPKEPSTLQGLGVPLMIGPMNGGMDYPRAFRRMQSRWSDAWFRFGRWLADYVNDVIPGKKKADLLLVANQRTEQALPRGCRGRVLRLVENGVDLNLWTPIDFSKRDPDAPLRLVWMGRMVKFKALDYLLRAFKELQDDPEVTRPVVLDLVGDGPEGKKLEKQCAELGLAVGKDVLFSGWMLQAEAAARVREADVLMLPSLAECGGAVVLEAMAMGLPCIAADWGGPQDYIVHGETGFLVPVESDEALVGGLRQSMKALVSSETVRLRMGRAGRRRVEALFDWERKADTMISLYEQVIEMHAGR